MNTAGALTELSRQKEDESAGGLSNPVAGADFYPVLRVSCYCPIRFSIPGGSPW